MDKSILKRTTKASQLIKHLEEMIKVHGDLPIIHSRGGFDSNITLSGTCAYDNNGGEENPTHFFIH